MLPGMMNSPLTITSIMRFAERVYPDSEIVSVTADNPRHRYTYADSFKRARQLANALAEFGMQAEDRIATLAWNDYRHFEIYYGVSGSGGICHTINPRLFPEQLEYIVNHAEDRLIFADPAFVPLLEKIIDKMPNVEKFVVLCDDTHMPDCNLKGVQSYEAFIGKQSDAFDWPQLDEDAGSALCYTSGTTGNPKGVLYTHRSTALHSYAAALPDTMNLSAGDVVLPIVPMFHVNAWNVPFAVPVVGAKLVFPGPKMGDGEILHELIESEQVTMSAGVPTVWLALLGYLANAGKTVPSLERVVVGGAACPLSIMDEFADKHGVTVHHAWGMTETGPLGVFNTLKPGMEELPKDELDKIRVKQGRPIYGVEIKIVDEAGNEQPWDGKAFGEVKIRGPWVCSGYFKMENSSAHDDDGWFATGDVATMDADGYMQITDRTKDVIKSGGEWISSIDLENAAVGHPQVAEAAVIGVPHPKWSERPLLLVVKKPDAELSKEEVLGYLEGKVAKWWIPEDAVFIDELPHTATGKISKKDLRDQFKDYQYS
ncbi:MAG: 3-(methylthio)propionyl-CoA ligase [Pseudomonadales bacterium]